MIKSLLTFFIVASLGIVAQAKTMKVPSAESPLASIDIPDGWHTQEIRGGFTGVNEDRDIYLVVVVLVHPFPLFDVQLDDTFTMLKNFGIVLDQSSRAKYNSRINGLVADETLFRAKGKGGRDPGPRKVSIIRVAIKDSMIVLTHFGSPADEEKHREEIHKIVKSLKPAL